jgi:peptidoglycan/LPS O-acetylase OafA/YrhL
MKALALLLALASLTINFGLIDLIDGYTGYVDQARNQVLDAGWGLVFGVILPAGLLAQLWRPERRIAGIQQTGVAALALAAAAVLGEAWWYLALAAGIAGVCAVLLARIRHDGRSSPVARAWSR